MVWASRSPRERCTVKKSLASGECGPFVLFCFLLIFHDTAKATIFNRDPRAGTTLSSTNKIRHSVNYLSWHAVISLGICNNRIEQQQRTKYIHEFPSSKAGFQGLLSSPYRAICTSMYSRHFQACSNPASKDIFPTFKQIGAHLFSTLGLLFASLIIPSRPHSSTARSSTLFFPRSFFIRTRTLTALFRIWSACAALSFLPPSFSTRHTHLCGPHDRSQISLPPP